MGVIGTHGAIRHLRSVGFEPVELERYCTSNKIWQTKVKRLRQPDLLCARTGTRFEVRGKSDLAIKMSHAEQNADRAWDAGLRDQDVVAFVPVTEENDGSFTAKPSSEATARQAPGSAACRGPPSEGEAP